MPDMPDPAMRGDTPDRVLFMPKMPKNVQVTRSLQHFGSLDAAGTLFPSALRLVFLCFTQRCGSTYLAQLIASGGLYNQPREYLNFEHVISRAVKRKLHSFGDYIADLVQTECRQDHLFIKITPLHLGLLAEAGLLSSTVARAQFVLIERSDKLAQAVSFAIARQTGKFTSSMQSRRSEADLVYQREPIARLLTGLVDSYRQFDLFFGMNGIAPVQIIYEQLIAQPAAALKLISDRLGVPEFIVRPENVRNARQTSATNAVWRAQFLGNAATPQVESGPKILTGLPRE